MLRVSNVSKRVGHRTLFRQLDFAWKQPDIVCIRGANGTGKTTLLSLLAGAAPFDGGDVYLCGHSLKEAPSEAARHVVYVPDECPIYPFVRGQEWLAFTASLHPGSPERTTELVDKFNIGAYMNTRFEEMSLGTARKFMLTACLSRSTPLLIMDEPTNGLDLNAVSVLQQALFERRRDTLVVLSCHDVAQQDFLAVRLVDLDSLEAA